MQEQVESFNNHPVAVLVIRSSDSELIERISDELIPGISSKLSNLVVSDRNLITAGLLIITRRLKSLGSTGGWCCSVGQTSPDGQLTQILLAQCYSTQIESLLNTPPDWASSTGNMSTGRERIRFQIERKFTTQLNNKLELETVRLLKSF